MATTSQTHSLIPTSTFSSAYSTPTDDSDGTSADSLSDILSSGGSPPLIVAFLAIGLFIVAMLGVFIWRRMSQSRRAQHRPITTNRRPRPVSLGEKPILWDVWADPHVQERPPMEATRWEYITPVAAILTFLIPPVEPPVARCPTSGPVDLGGRVLFRTLRCLVSAVRRFYLPDSPPPPPPPSAEPCKKDVILPVSDISDEIEWGDASSSQVSVIIAMPIQRRCCSGTSGEDMDPEGITLGESCIGTMNLPLSECG
ncbi:hypothetical protein OG21DRAFT_1515699 [Imleria badia]|nr:hypothetical protein OG21DRAFT_1515699 [Imleria badia]